MIPIIVLHPLLIAMSNAMNPAESAPVSRNIAPRIVSESGGVYPESIRDEVSVTYQDDTVSQSISRSSVM